MKRIKGDKGLLVERERREKGKEGRRKGKRKRRNLCLVWFKFTVTKLQEAHSSLAAK